MRTSGQAGKEVDDGAGGQTYVGWSRLRAHARLGGAQASGGLGQARACGPHPGFYWRRFSSMVDALCG